MKAAAAGKLIGHLPHLQITQSLNRTIDSCFDVPQHNYKKQQETTNSNFISTPLTQAADWNKKWCFLNHSTISWMKHHGIRD